MTRAALRSAARSILRAGLDAVEPGRLVRAHLSFEGGTIRAGDTIVRDPRRVFLVSVGKAAVPMARAAHRLLGRRINAAVVIAPARAPRLPRTTAFAAGHPIPNREGLRAARHVIRLLESASKGDLVLLLLSGGASALMPAPVKGVTLADKRRITRLLLMRGANIDELNAVRKRLSLLKGGGFARLASPATVATLAISDVPGDDVGTIGSGPTVRDRNAATTARRVVARFLGDVALPTGVRRALSAREIHRSRSTHARIKVIGSGRQFAEAAAHRARALGFRSVVREGALHGEARNCGPRLVRVFEEQRKRNPLCLIATGETVVRVLGNGRGGRNQEVALSAIGALSRRPIPTVLATLATDGRDGPTPYCGGLVDDLSSRRARKRGIDWEAFLENNDSSRALRSLNALLKAKNNRTNVADVTVLLG